MRIQKSAFFSFFVLAAGFVLTGSLAACSSDQPLRNDYPNGPTTKLRPGSLGRSGNPADVETAPLRGGILLAGGGTDQDAAMRWLLSRTKGGDVVILRATGTNAYNSYLFEMGGVNSVETFLVNTRELADNDTLAEAIRNAEALFFAGGNQADYVNYWKNTKLHDALLYALHEKKVPVGGTSAGCAILSGHVFDALQGSVVSAEALANPLDPKVSLSSGGFLAISLLQQVIADQHYAQRTRQGRHVAFMARLFTSTGAPVFGIGVDEKTAVCVDENGIASVFGELEAWFLQPGGENAEVLEAGKPLTWNRGGRAVKVYRITGSATGNGSFDLKNWESGIRTGGTEGFYRVENGVLNYGN